MPFSPKAPTVGCVLCVFVVKSPYSTSLLPLFPAAKNARNVAKCGSIDIRLPSGHCAAPHRKQFKCGEMWRSKRRHLSLALTVIRRQMQRYTA